MAPAKIAYIEDRDPRISWDAWECMCGRCFHVWAAVVPRPGTPGSCPACNADRSMITCAVR